MVASLMPATLPIAPDDQTQRPTTLARQHRLALRARREDLGLTADEVGHLIGKRLRELVTRFGEDPTAKRCRDLHGNTVRSWERYASHPSVDRMAAWARVLGWRWVTGFVEPGIGHQVVVHSQAAAELAQLGDALAEDDVMWLLHAARRMAPSSE